MRPAPPARWYGTALALCATVLIGGCGKSTPATSTLRAAGELRIATLNGGITYYEGTNGRAGFDFELASRFAASLGVTPRFINVRDVSELESLLRAGKVHLGAAMLPVRELDDADIAFGPSYAVARQLVVVRRGRQMPQAPEDLRGLSGGVSQGHGAALTAQRRLAADDGFDWRIVGDSSDELLGLIDRGELDYAVLPGFEFHAARAYFPELLPAFELGQPRAIAWLYRTHVQNSLWHAQLEFFRDLRETGVFATLEQRYLRHAEAFDYVESRAFLRDYARRLPDYREAFRKVAREQGFDWLLLAAMGYQESHWRADARSPTGVRGLMMLTEATARELGVDRLDPLQSIEGGARYLRRLIDRLPERIEEPDRTWLALAAYNIGLGHLEDARVLTARNGDDPDSWAAVREHLPRLSHKAVARKLRHGYARGYQAVHFVTNVRRYYELLHWLNGGRDTFGPPAPRPRAPLVSPVL